MPTGYPERRRAPRTSGTEVTSMSRLRTRIALALAFSSPVLVQLPQSERAKPGERDIFGRPMDAEPHHDLLKNMQGAWRLIEIRDELLPLAGRSHYGYITFADRFMSVEIHMRWADRAGEALEDAFQCGTHEIEFISASRMRTTTLIGAYLDEWEQLEWEIPGFNREFEISTNGDQLILRRDIGSELVFRRQTIGRGVFTDVFGVPQGTRDNLDIFGAPMPEPELEEEDLEGTETDDESGTGDTGDAGDDGSGDEDDY